MISIYIMSISDATFFEIIGRELNIYFITVDERDIALAHMSWNMSKNDHTIVSEILTRERIYLNPVTPVWERLEDSASGKYFLFFSHEMGELFMICGGMIVKKTRNANLFYKNIQ